MTITSPPDRPVKWRVRCGDCFVVVEQQSWFAARADGASKLGVDVGGVSCERTE